MTHGRTHSVNRGDTLVDVALLLALIAVICIVALMALGGGDNEPGSSPPAPSTTATSLSQ